VSFTERDVCFVGLGKSAVAYYRCLLPAQAMGADWAGLAGLPPKMAWVTGLTRKESNIPKLDEYKVVVIQQPRGRGWLDVIKELQRHDVKVLCEYDDYLHGIRKLKDHSFAKSFTKERLAEHELCMRACDGLIASTQFIATRYRKFQPNTWVCRNGLDLGRYNLTLPERTTTNIIWAGATGHTNSAIPWLQAIAKVMAARPNVTFVSIGQPFANGFRQAFGNRALAVPFCAIEQYPGAMTMGDIAIAPAGRSTFARGKSPLRHLEASALGIPTIGDPFVYDTIVDGENGLRAETADEAEAAMLRLVDDVEERRALGARAREWVRAERSVSAVAPAWVSAFEEILGDRADPAGFSGILTSE
jgi:glycosyltransferase involved in cell wall biosynthesis